MSANIKVAVRCRPLKDKEKPAAGLDIQSRRIVADLRTYDPDITFPPTSTQQEVFAACLPILDSVMSGCNGTIMVYGQTGTGKTHTMLGTEGEPNGIAFRAMELLLQYVQQRTVEGAKVALALSIVEIYNERITDMLSPQGDTDVSLVGGYPKQTTKITLCKLEEAVEVVHRGLESRHVAQTMLNEHSSRSHVLLLLDLEEFHEEQESYDVTRLILVDLAGSESIKKSQATGVAAAEAGKINKSLLSLKNVFLALSSTTEASRPGHVPYRDSKLTEMLQDSIGGSARTMLIACISSNGRDIEETKSTLMYALKARSIRNVANTERDRLLVRVKSLEIENQKLRNRLIDKFNERGGYFINKEDNDKYAYMEDENAQLKLDLQSLLHERQQVTASHHIAESQQKVLQAIVDEKQKELNEFKVIYAEAIQRFERHSFVLQQRQCDAMLLVQDTVEKESLKSQAQWDCWQEASAQLPLDVTYEARIQAICQRLNDTVTRLASEFLRLRQRLEDDTAILSRKRTKTWESFSASLQETVLQHLQSYQKAEESQRDDLHRVLQLHKETVEMYAEKMPEPADPQELMDLLSDASGAVRQQAADAYPHPGTIASSVARVAALAMADSRRSVGLAIHESLPPVSSMMGGSTFSTGSSATAGAEGCSSGRSTVETEGGAGFPPSNNATPKREPRVGGTTGSTFANNSSVSGQALCPRENANQAVSSGTNRKRFRSATNANSENIRGTTPRSRANRTGKPV